MIHRFHDRQIGMNMDMNHMGMMKWRMQTEKI